jgi:hypothetical protein
MARYEAIARHFIAPHTIEPGQQFTVPDSWPPTPHVIPLDAAAEKAVAEYNKLHPYATTEPILDLPNYGNEILIEEKVERPPELVIVDPNAKPELGLSDGGVLPPSGKK